MNVWIPIAQNITGIAQIFGLTVQRTFVVTRYHTELEGSEPWLLGFVDL